MVPLGAGKRTEAGGALVEVAHLEENLAAAAFPLDDDEYEVLGSM